LTPRRLPEGRPRIATIWSRHGRGSWIRLVRCSGGSGRHRWAGQRPAAGLGAATARIVALICQRLLTSCFAGATRHPSAGPFRHHRWRHARTQTGMLTRPCSPGRLGRAGASVLRPGRAAAVVGTSKRRVERSCWRGTASRRR
jgi:hypothetical protein